jgi:MFS family permease|tara:strand:+ start:90 stop:1406 length:1317 start_codon:yes stop_codon:yes gene_type:complete
MLEPLSKTVMQDEGVISVFRSIFSLLLSYGLLLLANGLFNSLLGLRATLEGVSTSWLGFIMASYFLGLLLGGLFAGRIVARVGHIRAFAVFASLMSTTALLHPLFLEVSYWMLLRLVSGFCMAGLIMVTESWLNDATPSHQRGGVLSSYMMVNYMAAGCGQFLLNMGDVGQFELFSLASIIFSLALIPVLLTKQSAPIITTDSKLSFGLLAQVGPLAILGVFVAGASNASVHAFAPVYALEVLGDARLIPQFTATLLISGLVLQWPLGRLSDRIGRGWLMMFVPICISISAIFVILATHYAPDLIWFAVACYGAFLFTLYSIAVALINDIVGPELRVKIAGAILIVYGLGAISGPIIVGPLIDLIGVQALFMVSILTSSLLAGLAIYRRVYQAIFVKPVQPFVAVPSNQYSSKELYLAAHQQKDEQPELSPQEDVTKP